MEDRCPNGDYLAETVEHTYTKGAGLLTKIIGKPPGDDAIDVLSEAISEQALDADKQLLSPTPGRKLGVPYSPPVFDATRSRTAGSRSPARKPRW